MMPPRQRSNPTAPGSIYGIADPRDHVIRYVGQTTQPLSRRLGGHLNNARPSRLRTWFDTLIAAGVRPEILLLKSDVAAGDLDEAEAAEITRRLADGDQLLNEASTARGRRVLYQRVRADDAAATRRGWHEVATAVRALLGGPLAPPLGEPPALPPEAWQAIRAGELPPFGRSDVGRIVWDVFADGWREVSFMTGGDSWDDLRDEVDIALRRPFATSGEASRYISLLPWLGIAVLPWWEMAERAGLAESDEQFIAWIGPDTEAGQALRLASHYGRAGLRPLVRAMHRDGSIFDCPAILAAVAAAHGGITLPAVLNRPIATTLAALASRELLTAPLADLLVALNPRALDEVFGRDVCVDLDRRLALPPGTSGKVVRALAADPVYSGVQLDRLAHRSTGRIPTAASLDFSVRLRGRGVPPAQAVAAGFVAAGILPPTPDESVETFVARIAVCWSPEVERSWLKPVWGL
jgi:hypothetical protein